jgi:GH25 family lysozyme M1 (1,4-beta-N-acetylmuramidase)
LTRKLISGKRTKKKGEKTVLMLALLFAVLSIGAVIFIFQDRLTSYFTPFRQAENTYLSDSKNFGIDISHYQGLIDWTELGTSEHCINYIFIRATMGADGQDVQFKSNWKNAKENNYLRGAYHYYRPNENSVVQFENFSKMVKLDPGDFPPVLDIEEMGKYGTENLVAGILNWLRLAEKHYGVIPIVYTGSNFYRLYLKDRIEVYPLWIAAYSEPHKINDVDWKFHQFSHKMRINGIDAYVDGNSFNGEMEDLVKLCK